jgi:outer membrane protein assembly factor BamD (BamD/ComL family)
MRPFYAGPSGPRILGLILLVAASGCAYYNTFYLAKKYYREGTRAQEKSLSDEPSPEASSKYDLVIRQCNKILTEYPKSKYVDDASYMMGASMYGKRDYDGAIKRFEEFPTKFPKSPYVPDARYMEDFRCIGVRVRRRGSSSDVDAFPSGATTTPVRRRARSSMGRSRVLVTGPWTRQRRRRSTPSGLATPTPKPDRHGRRLRPVSQVGGGFSGVTWPSPAATASGRCTRTSGRLISSNWKVFTLGGAVKGAGLRVECMALLGRVNEAIGGYRNLIEKFPRTSVAYDAQFRVGYLYESELQDFDGAAREYDKLKNQPQSEFSSQALRRGQNLATLRQYRTAMASDTTQTRAGAAFMMAELYYFQLEKPDSAVLQYRRVESEFPQSIYAAKSAYARLWIMTHDRNDTLGAMALTDSIARQYHGTRYAESPSIFGSGGAAAGTAGRSSIAPSQTRIQNGVVRAGGGTGLGAHADPVVDRSRASVHGRSWKPKGLQEEEQSDGTSRGEPCPLPVAGLARDSHALRVSRAFAAEPGFDLGGTGGRFLASIQLEGFVERGGVRKRCGLCSRRRSRVLAALGEVLRPDRPRWESASPLRLRSLSRRPGAPSSSWPPDSGRSARVSSSSGSRREPEPARSVADGFTGDR